jgi:large subunit ribosomal protein L29
MPHVKPSAIRDMSVDEIGLRIVELREELFNLRFRNSMKQLDNPLRIREGRREMARLLTVLEQKQPAGPPASTSGQAAPKPAAKRQGER